MRNGLNLHCQTLCFQTANGRAPPSISVNKYGKHSQLLMSQVKKMQVAERRLKRELTRLMTKPPEGISCYQKDDRLNMLIATVTGPCGSPYEGGLFKLEVEVDDHYPFQPPKLKFITSVYHPNIDTGGRICMDLLKVPPKGGTGGWNPTITLESLLVAVQMLLENPNPDDPLMADIANEYRLNKQLFEKKARQLTQEHAKN